VKSDNDIWHLLSLFVFTVSSAWRWLPGLIVRLLPMFTFTVHSNLNYYIFCSLFLFSDYNQPVSSLLRRYFLSVSSSYHLASLSNFSLYLFKYSPTFCNLLLFLLIPISGSVLVNILYINSSVQLLDASHLKTCLHPSCSLYIGHSPWSTLPLRNFSP
jgi:hypothetical protein